MGALAVGLDLGTSGMKAIALDATGAVVGRGQAGYPTHRPEPGASEQDPQDWIMAMRQVVAQVRAATGDRPWDVIGLSGMIPTLVTADDTGAAIGRAITWEDARAEPEGDSLREAVGADDLYRRTGQWVDGRYLLPMLARLSRVDAGRVAASTTLLGAKDFVYAWLTGRAHTDPSTATGFGCYDLESGRWDEEISRLAEVLSGGAALRLPEVVPSTSHAPLTASAAGMLGLPAGMPVCLGAADSVLGAIGMGVTEPGGIAYVGGTSTIVLGVTGARVIDPLHRFLVTPMVEDGRWGLEMDLLATGGAVRWLAGLLGERDEASLMRLAAAADPATGPVFLPYVAPGEQGALWDPSLTGSLLGLHVGHSAADVARALIDGIVVESRRCLLTLEDSGFGPGPIHVSGGSAADPWFRQQLADACERSVVTTGGDEPDRSALGAAVVAASSIGRQPPVAVADEASASPAPRAADRWRRAAARQDECLEVVRRLAKCLTANGESD